MNLGNYRSGRLTSAHGKNHAVSPVKTYFQACEGEDSNWKEAAWIYQG